MMKFDFDRVKNIVVKGPEMMVVSVTFPSLYLLYTFFIRIAKNRNGVVQILTWVHENICKFCNLFYCLS